MNYYYFANTRISNNLFHCIISVIIVDFSSSLKFDGLNPMNLKIAGWFICDYILACSMISCISFSENWVMSILNLIQL